MSHYEFEIPAAPLKAALLCTAHKDIRFYPLERKTSGFSPRI